MINTPQQQKVRRGIKILRDKVRRRLLKKGARSVHHCEDCRAFSTSFAPEDRGALLDFNTLDFIHNAIVGNLPGVMNHWGAFSEDCSLELTWDLVRDEISVLYH